MPRHPPLISFWFWNLDSVWTTSHFYLFFHFAIEFVNNMNSELYQLMNDFVSLRFIHRLLGFVVELLTVSECFFDHFHYPNQALNRYNQHWNLLLIFLRPHGKRNLPPILVHLLVSMRKQIQCYLQGIYYSLIFAMSPSLPHLDIDQQWNRMSHLLHKQITHWAHLQITQWYS